jgi:hypothetical protein
LQKAGLSPQKIFEETGFEPIQQNQIIVAAQVYDSVVKVGTTEAVQTHFQQRGSDLLYELRILSQGDRARVADFALSHSLDADIIKDIVKAVKEYSYRKAPPSPLMTQWGMRWPTTSGGWPASKGTSRRDRA